MPTRATGASSAMRRPALAAVVLAACLAAATAAALGAAGDASAAHAAVAGAAQAPSAAPGGSAGAAAPAAARYGPLPGPFAVEAMDLDWFDQDRNRAVPVRVYFPKRGAGPFPVVVFSSAVGAGRGSLEFLGRHLASHGYVSVHVQHLGADDQIPVSGGNRRAAAARAARDPRTGIARLLDLVFALDQVTGLAARSPVLHGRIDLAAVAAGGHYLGAWTALAAAGLAAVGEDGEESSLPDPRVKAALLIALPPAPPKQRANLRFEHVKVPCLHLLAAPTTAQQQQQEQQPRQQQQQPGPGGAAPARLAFDRISGADQVLVTFLGEPGPPLGPKPAAAGGSRSGGGASGGGGSGTGGAGAGGQLELVERIKTVSTAFLEAYLRHDAAAREWLSGGGLAAALGKGASVETRPR